jgi:phosphate starvation-inducible PhoH-like protein
MGLTEMTIQVASHDEAMVLFGLGDRNLKLLREAFGIQVTGRGCALKLVGEKAPVDEAGNLLGRMMAQIRSGETISPNYLEKELEKRGPRQNHAPSAQAEAPGRPADVSLRSEGDGHLAPRSPQFPRSVQGDGSSLPARYSAELTSEQRIIVEGVARSQGQESYLQAILQNDIVFCIGPAGTGKTFLAVRMAVNFLRAGEIRKLILCRPAVEAGEKLGFLPGDFQAKINPYLRPLYDALNDILDFDQVKRYLEREIIEIIPLAYMRGRTLNNAFIILDEGQNTSISQMRMFLTRMGMSSRIVVNGDVTQVDLPEGQPSGLIHAQRVIREIPGIAWIQLQKADIVRHPLVRRIVEAYEENEEGPPDVSSRAPASVSARDGPGKG